ncbi:MAG: hypothetical protein AAGJ40_09685 [Planctomycetota bacterium]
MALPDATSQVVGTQAAEGGQTYEVVSVGGINAWNRVTVEDNPVSNADIAKLAGIEALADVTDAANVSAAGAVMESDTTTAAMSFVIDDDTMATASANTVSTSESTKAYADSLVVDEVVESAGPLSGAAPSGAKYGVDTVAGQGYYVSGGNWAAVPTASVDLNVAVSDQTGGNGTGTLVPASPATATPDIGDVEQDVYDDVVIYFTATATDWTSPAVVEVPRNVIDFADALTASDDATGDGGTASTAARSDHKHAYPTIQAANSDSGLPLVTNDHGQVSQDAVKVVVLGAAPVDGTTVAYYVGQLFWDNVNKNLYEATAASADPDTDGTGSAFAQVSIGENVYNADGSLGGTRLVDVGGNFLVLRNGPTSTVNQISLSAGTVDATDVVGGMQNRQLGRISIDGFVDFTTAEPSLVAGMTYVNTVTGTSSGTSQAVTAGRIYQVVNTAAGFTERVPADGWQVFDRSNESVHNYDGIAWVRVASDLSATLIDASAAAITETLPAATGSGAVVLYANNDVTNTATLAVASGDKLNGVTDGTFLFSNYDAGTQFRVDDVEAGDWVVSVAGASASTRLKRYSIRGVDANRTQLSGINAINLGSLVASDTLVGGAFELFELDDDGLRVGNTVVIPDTGFYRFDITMNHTAANLSGTSGQNTDGVTLGGIRVNSGSPIWLMEDGGSGLPDILKASGYRNFTAGDVVELIFEADGASDEDWYIDFTLEQPADTEAVLAGMIVPTALATGRVDLATDQGLAASFADVAGMEVTLPNPGKYRVFGQVSTYLDGSASSGNINTRLFNVTDNSAIDGSNTTVFGGGSTGTWNHGSSQYYEVELDVSAATTIRLQGELGGSLITASIDNTDTFLAFQQLPTSTVVNPEAVPVEDLASFSVAKTDAVQTTSSNTYPAQELVTFNSVVRDTNSGYASNQYTVPAGKGGLWSLNLGIETVAAGILDGQSTLQIVVNGVEVARSGFATAGDNVGGAGSNDVNYGSLSKEVELNEGDVVEAYVSMAGGISLTAQSATTFFEGSQQTTRTITALNPAFTEAKDLSYLHAFPTGTLLTNGTGLTTTTASSRGTDIANNGDGTFTLKSGYTYKLECHAFTNVVFNQPFWWTDGLNGTQVGTAGNAVTVDEPSARQNASAIAFVSPTTDTTYGLDSASGIAFFGGVGTNSGSSDIIITQLPSAEYVTPGDVPVGDVEVELLAGTHTGTGQGSTTLTLANGTWNDIFNSGDYEYIEFQLFGGNLSLSISHRISVTQILASSLIRAGQNQTGAGASGLGTSDLIAEIGNYASGDVVLGQGTGFINSSLRVVGIKPQKTVINTTDLTITNPNEADTTTVLKPNGDGTATFQTSTAAGANLTQVFYIMTAGAAVNGSALPLISTEYVAGSDFSTASNRIQGLTAGNNYRVLLQVTSASIDGALTIRVQDSLNSATVISNLSLATGNVFNREVFYTPTVDGDLAVETVNGASFGDQMQALLSVEQIA